MKRSPETLVLFALVLAVVALGCGLTAWWGHLIIQQAQQLHEAERVEHMIRWEQRALWLLWLLLGGMVGWFHWRFFQRSRAIQNFFAGMTHELRTPLSSIRLQTEALLDLLPSTAAGTTLCNRLARDTERLEAQVNRALELARIEGGAKVLLETVEVAQFIQDVLAARAEPLSQTTKSTGTYRHSKFLIEVHVEPIYLRIDRAALRLIVDNVLDNMGHHARAAQDTPLTLDICGHRVVPEEQLVPSYSLSFHDNGRDPTGTAPATRDLGKLFHRGSASKGTGIGLYLVRTLGEAMGAKVKFFAGPSQAKYTGFSVELVLPVAGVPT